MPRAHFLDEGRLRSGEDIAGSWRDNPAAAACFASLQPLKDVEDRLAAHMRRIEHARSTAQIAANAKAHEESFSGMCPLHFYTTDTTKAGLESNLSGRAMASFVDEASDQADQRGAQTLLNLITAATGG